MLSSPDNFYRPNRLTVPEKLNYMKKFKYIISNPDGSSQETWVCSKCKKKNNGLILQGKWKLIDRCDDATACLLCELELVDGEGSG